MIKFQASKRFSPCGCSDMGHHEVVQTDIYMSATAAITLGNIEHSPILGHVYRSASTIRLLWFISCFFRCLKPSILLALLTTSRRLLAITLALLGSSTVTDTPQLFANIIRTSCSLSELMQRPTLAASRSLVGFGILQRLEVSSFITADTIASECTGYHR